MPRSSAHDGLTAVAAFTLTGGYSGLDRKTDSQTYDVADPVTAVRVENRGGAIDIVATDQHTVKVVETYTYSNDKPHTTRSVRDGELTLQATGCDSTGWFDHCGGVAYRVEVPRATATHLENGGGTITVQGLSGAVYAHTGGGTVSVQSD
ncbi:hypothetical protein [Nocardia sp. NPDC051570]|uniref:hypothetical protein n=1 Tax=Nocardia sp. NPDC051570 TaxID=3364324 RepID=UPI0037891B3F